MMAKGTFTHSVSWKHDEKEKDSEVGCEAGDIRNGKAVGCLVEKIDLLVASSFNGKKRDGA